MRTCFLDLETSGLVANFGIVLCGVVKVYGAKPKVFRLDESPGYSRRRWDDRHVVRRIRDEVSRHDVVITYNGKRFDKPFLNTRLITLNIDHWPRQYHHDYYFTARYKLRLHSNRLDVVLKAVLGRSCKTAITPEVWIKALTGDKPSMDYIVHHCVLDVTELEKLHDKLKIFMPMVLRKT